MSTYVPKVGDRVRVTHEGVIEQISKNGDLFRVGGGRTFTWFDSLHPEKVVVEKLADPEPEWVNGDVVRSVNGDVRVRFRDHWWNPACSPSAVGDYRVSENWQDGTLEILYKADAQKKVA